MTRVVQGHSNLRDLTELKTGNVLYEFSVWRSQIMSSPAGKGQSLDFFLSIMRYYWEVLSYDMIWLPYL